MFKSNTVRALGLSLGMLSCSAASEQSENVTANTNKFFAIKGYTLVHTPNRTALGMLDENFETDTEHNRVRVHTVIDGKEVLLDCPVRERCKGVFDMPVDNQKFLESQFFGCVDWESGCVTE